MKRGKPKRILTARPDVPRKTKELEKFFLGGDDYRPHYMGTQVRLHDLNILRQPRQTFESIPELALDIAQKGILNPPTVACFSKEQAARYVEALNLLWRTTFTTTDLRPADDDQYYILLAGERRTRACKLLWENGCMECIEQAQGDKRRLKPGDCFKRHFETEADMLDIRLCRDIPPISALFLQLSENTHMQVPPHEEAQAYALLYNLCKQADAEFSVSKFARRVGRSPETIRHALRFVELPTQIRTFVEQRLLPYGIAIELTRLSQVGLDEHELLTWTNRALVDHIRVSDFHERISRFLQNRNSGQVSLFEFSQEELAAQERDARRKTVEANIVKALWALFSYFQRLRVLFAEGAIGKEDSPFSAGSPNRILQRVVALERELIPHFRSLGASRRLNHLALTVHRIERLAAALPLAPGREDCAFTPVLRGEIPPTDDSGSSSLFESDTEQ